MSDEPWSAVYDSARAIRVEALRPFGFTDRQARFLVTVMAHSGSFLERQYCAFARIARGQNSREFVARLVTRGVAAAITPGSVRRGRLYHVHYKPLYEAIGEPNNRHRKRQSTGRMVQRLMVLDGVLGDRSCWWMGTENDKRTFFAQTQELGMSAREFPQIAFGNNPRRTVRYFPDKLPIGVEKHNHRHHVFLYLVTRRIPVDFRQFLIRHVDLFRLLHDYTVRLLVPRRFARAVALYKAALREELWTPLEPHVATLLEAYFRERQQDGGHLMEPTDPYLVKALRQHGRARFASLYRAWRRMGDAVLWNARSHCLRDDRLQGNATCEVEILNRQYLQLAGTISRDARPGRGAKRESRQVGPPISTLSVDALSPLVTP